MATVLIVDDDEAIRATLKAFLERQRFAVLARPDGLNLLSTVHEARPDIILLDARLPGLGGHELCRALKSHPDTKAIPVLIMSGDRTKDSDVVAAIDDGADDYLLKPFSMPVLRAKIEAGLRRHSPAAPPRRAPPRYGLKIDQAARSVSVYERAIDLTRKEFDLLVMLTSRAGRVLSCSFLLESVWGYDPADYNDPHTVEVHISHLRTKLGRKLGSRIVSVLGHGYRFDNRPGSFQK